MFNNARSEDSFFRQLTSLKTNSFNPFYSQEEFTYNQDPIVIDHDTNDLDDDNEIFEPFQFAIKPRGERHIESFYKTEPRENPFKAQIAQEKSSASVDFDKLLSERLSHSGEGIKLVNTIEYTATDYKGNHGIIKILKYFL